MSSAECGVRSVQAGEQERGEGMRRPRDRPPYLPLRGRLKLRVSSLKLPGWNLAEACETLSWISELR